MIRRLETAQGRGSNTIVLDDRTIQVPAWVVDLESFREWTDSDEVDEKDRICYLNGEVWIDMSGQQIFSHTAVKSEYNSVLYRLTKGRRSGRYFHDGAFFTNVEANFSAKPDGLFVSERSLTRGRIRFVEGKKTGGYVELEGVADMVLEVVSQSSVKKDTVTLRDLYWRAGIQEYWLVDARGEKLEFDILRHGANGYVASRKQQGWIKSAVFGKSFRLRARIDRHGHPEFALLVR